MKVLLLTNVVENLRGHRQGLIRGLLRHGAEVVLASGGKGASAETQDTIRRRFNSWSPSRCSYRFVPLSPHSINPFHDLILLWALYRLMRRERPDLVLLFTVKPNIYGNLAAWMAGIPTVSTLTGLGYAIRTGNRLSVWLVCQLYRLALRWPEKVFFHNTGDLQWMIDRRLVSSEKSRVVPGSGVDTGKFRPRLKPSRDPFVFLFLGRLLKDKGLPELAQAAEKVRALHPNIEVWVAGAFSPRYPAAVSERELQAWVEAGGIRYLGEIDDVRPVIQRAQALVLPSHHEGMPVAVLEAMAMGRPVLASDIPACREAIAPGDNGFLFPAGDPDAIASSMIHFYSLSPYERFSLGRNGRQRAVRNFSLELVVNAYLGR